MDKDFMKQTHRHNDAIRHMADEIVKYSRGLVATLKDAGRENASKELEALIFSYDATLGEATNFLKGNIDTIVEAMMGRQR